MSAEAFYPCRSWFEDDFTVKNPATWNTRIQAVEWSLLDAWTSKQNRHHFGVNTGELGIRGRSILVTGVEEVSDMDREDIPPIVLHNPVIVGRDGSFEIQWHEDGIAASRPSSCLIEYVTTAGDWADVCLLGIAAASAQFQIECLDGKPVPNKPGKPG